MVSVEETLLGKKNRVAGGAFRDSPAQDPARTQDLRRRSRPPPPHPRAQGSNRKLLQRQVRKMTGRGQEQAGGLDSVPGQCLKQTRGRAVKHAGHHEAAAPCCPPTPAATCVITPDEVMRRIQDLGYYCCFYRAGRKRKRKWAVGEAWTFLFTLE